MATPSEIVDEIILACDDVRAKGESVLVPSDGRPVAVAKVNCATSDSFPSIWAKVARELGLIEERENWKDPFAELDPDDVPWALEKLPSTIIVLH